MNKFVLMVWLSLCTQNVFSEQYSAQILHLDSKINNQQYELNVEIEYGLSPIAKEALQKGISLTWSIIVKVQQQGILWSSTLKTLKMKYQVQNHALLNLYSIKNVNNGTTTMFSTLTAALASISNIQNLFLIEKKLINHDKNYHLSIKVNFDREALPVPLRPMSYFNSDWALSSPWSIWQLQN